MKNQSNKKLTPNAQELRKNMTKEEKHLWYDFLKTLPFDVKRQKVIFDYIVDFYIPKFEIAIELDGIQHYTDEHILYDEIRDKKLKEAGITVLRYPNSDINKRFEGVCADIVMRINEKSENKK